MESDGGIMICSVQDSRDAMQCNAIAYILLGFMYRVKARRVRERGWSSLIRAVLCCAVLCRSEQDKDKDKTGQKRWIYICNRMLNTR